MNTDIALITGLRQAEKATCAEYSKAYADFADSSCAQTILSVLDGHLRIAKKLAQLESMYKTEDETEYPTAGDIIAFRHAQKMIDKN